MPPTDPGNAGLVCHYCRCLSPHTYSCADCGREFCLQCVPTRGPAPQQTIRCPGCGSRKIQRQDPAQDSPPA